MFRFLQNSPHARELFVHIMAYKQEELVPEIAAEAGLPVTQPTHVT